MCDASLRAHKTANVVDGSDGTDHGRFPVQTQLVEEIRSDDDATCARFSITWRREKRENAPKTP